MIADTMKMTMKIKLQFPLHSFINFALKKIARTPSSGEPSSHLTQKKKTQFFGFSPDIYGIF